MSGETDELDHELNLENANEVSFNLESVYNSFKNGLIRDDDINLNCYIEAYKELCKFFIVLGSTFQFMATDVKSKIKILEDLQNEEKTRTGSLNHFSTIKNMILWEKEEKLLENEKYVSGSRTLLRLHRGLDFIKHFLKEIYELEDSIKIGGVCRTTYDKTLADYHTWIIKNAARVAMKFLPTREVFLKKMSKNDPETIRRALQLMPEMLSIMEVVYNRVQKLYSQHDLLNLP